MVHPFFDHRDRRNSPKPALKANLAQDGYRTYCLRAIEILLRKCLPDLARAEVVREEPQRYVIEVPAMLSEDEWVKKYSPPTLEGKAEAEETEDLPSLADIRKLR
jgi:hypothetical protein